MPKMISLRNFRLASLSGVTIWFEANVPTEVPATAVQEAMNNGCVPVNLEGAPSFDDNRAVKVDFQGDIRRSIIFLAIQSVMEENNLKNFDGANMPKRSVISERIGGDIHAKELVDVFQEYTAAKNQGREFLLHESAANVLRVIEAPSMSDLLDLAEEFGEPRAQFKGAQTREVRKSLLRKFTGAVAE